MENQTMSGAESWTDEALLDRMLRKEQRAWREFHRRYDRLIYRCIHKITNRFTHVMSSEDVCEIYAMLMMSLTAKDMQKLRAFDAKLGTKLSSWIAMLATNVTWDYLRGLARQPHCSSLADATDVGESTSNPYEDFLAKERWGRVNATLKTFSRRDQTFVMLYYVDGLTPEEIAREMRVSVKTVYSKKHKISHRLGRALHDQEYAPVAA